MGTVQRVVDIGALKARLRARLRWVDLALAVQERFGAVGGGPLSSSLGLAMFLSLFPLLLVLIAVVGFLSWGNADFASNVIDDLGLQGEAARTVEDAITVAEGSRQAATVIGLLGLLWAGMAVVGSLQAACNAVWQVTGRGLLDRAFALRWLVVAGSLLLAASAAAPVLGAWSGAPLVFDLVLGAALGTVLFTWTYTTLGNASVGWRVHLPGAVTVALGFEVLKQLGAVYLPRAVAGSSALYGSIGVVFATLAWIAIYARLIVYGAVLNVVRYELHHGTVTVEIEVPKVHGEVPRSANRGGAVDVRAEPSD